MAHTTPLKDRLSGALLALALQAGALSLFFFSFEAMRQAAPEQREITLSFPRPVPRQEMPVTIDARGPPRRIAPPAPSAAQPPVLLLPPSDLAPTLPPPPGALQALGRALLGCTPEKMADLSASQRANCPPPPAPPSETKHSVSEIGTPAYKSKNQAQYDEEMARKNGTAGGASSLLVRPAPPGPAIPTEPPSIGGAVVVKDPLCHLFLTLLNVKNFSCGPAPPAPPVSDDKVKAALDAASRRHGIIPPAAKTSDEK